MIPIAELAKGSSTLIFDGSIEKRPVEPLLASLKDLGAKAHVGKLGGKDAVFVDGGGIVGGETSIPGDVSSQFISGLMFACPMAQVDTEIMLSSPLESADYVKMTQAVLADHKIKVPATSKPYSYPSKPNLHAVRRQSSRRLFLSRFSPRGSSYNQLERPNK